MVTQSLDEASLLDEAPSVSLVLGSGGARGLAHIGVIEVLTERGYRIESIVGCSMGALIGGVYATGQLGTYRDWVCALERVDVLRMLDVSFGSMGLIRGDKLLEVLRELIGETQIDDLPVKYTAVATDIDTRKEVWLDQGHLFDAIRASIAIPAVFAPVRRDGRTLVDGGLLNPVPVTPTVRDSTQLTIAVDLSGPYEESIEKRISEAASSKRRDADKKRTAIDKFVGGAIDKIAEAVSPDRSERNKSLLDVVSRSFDVMQGTLSRHKLASNPPDLMISVPRNSCQIFDFHKASALIDVGRARATKALESLPKQEAEIGADAGANRDGSDSGG